MQRIESGATTPSGTFITLEGVDGSGKSRQQALLVERLRLLSREVVSTREPGGTELGERIRGVLLDTPMLAHDGLTDALLFNAARRRLVAEVIRPALARGDVVVSDRFGDSTVAYQGSGSEVPVEALRMLGQLSTGATRPNRTVLLDVPVEVGLERRRQGAASEMTRFELTAEHDAGFQERVRQSYLAMAAEEPERWRVVDASGTPEEVSERVWDAVSDLFAVPREPGELSR